MPAELRVGSLNIDLVHREARVDNELIKLTTREFDLLAFLARHAGRLCTHQMILDAVWGSRYSHETQYVHTYMHRLRQKLLDSEGTRIENAPGIGYTLRSTAAPDEVAVPS
jgi:two-component system KDP operon response regulator KdpE